MAIKKVRKNITISELSLDRYNKLKKKNPDRYKTLSGIIEFSIEAIARDEGVL